MALYLDPATHPEAWNTVVFARIYRTPGKCLVTGFSRDNDFDIKTGKGTAGATETLKGQPPAKGSITFWAWTPEQRQAWTAIINRLLYKPAKVGTSASPAAAPGTSGFASGGTGGGEASGSVIPAPGNTTGKAKDKKADDDSDKTKDPPALTKADAIEVFYPSLADIGVNYVLPPEKIGMWEPEGDDYTYLKRKIDFVEFTQPPAANIAATPTGAADGSNEPGVAAAGGQEKPAPTGASAQAKGAGKDGQAAWGGP